MKSVVIPATKNTIEKTFTIKDIWMFPDSDDIEYITKIVDITDNHIFFKSLVTEKIIKATTKQHSIYTKFATNNKRAIINTLFEINSDYLG